MKREEPSRALRSWLAAGATLALLGATAALAQPARSGAQPNGEVSRTSRPSPLPTVPNKLLPNPDDPGGPGEGGGGGGGGIPPRARNGMTWRKIDHNSSFGADRIDCNGCDAYFGETSCSTYLPVLCINIEGSPNPGISTTFYSGWTGGNIAHTAPVQGTSLGSLANANLLCSAFLGAGWRMAEFHDGGGGWGFWAYGNVNSATRFWTYINDQPSNCWN